MSGESPQMQFPWLAYWAAGLLMMLLIAEHAPKGITYSLLGIILIGSLLQREQTRTRKGPK